MRQTRLKQISPLLLGLAFCAGPAFGLDRIVLPRSGPQAGVSLPQGALPTVRYAAEILQAAIADLGGPRLAVSEDKTGKGQIILATRDCPAIALSPRERDALSEEAYLAKVTAADGERRLVLVGGSQRALVYGAARLSELGLSVEGQDVALEADGKVHAPALAMRGNYTLACWGKTHLWTRQHWCHVFDAMAADSMNVVLFWLSGLFPSKQYPASVVYPETRIGVEDLRAMIRHAHARGMKFLIGSGIFAWFGVDAIAGRFPETRASGSGGMCPSQPLARRINQEYLLEMLEALPEADGFFLEIRDEYGPCTCPTCQRRLDQRGSRQYGQAELSFLKELTAEVWKRNPKAIFVSSIGYGVESQGAHTDDVQFYDGVRQLNDPRLFWLVCRNNWDFPAAEGTARPLRWFSGNMLQWTQYYRLSTAELGKWIHRTRDAGCVGFLPALEPGFCSASWYSDEVPYPVDRIPYVVTRFAYREHCWEPDMTTEEFRRRLSRRFFGPGATARLADDLLQLFDLIRAESQNTALIPDGKWTRHSTRRLLEEAERASPMANSLSAWTRIQHRLESLASVGVRRHEMVEQMEQRLKQAMPALDPRGRRSVSLMLEALADTRDELCLAPSSRQRLQATLAHAKQSADRLKQNAPATATADSEYNDTTYAACRVLDGDLKSSWLCKDRASLPQTITITLRQKRTIDYVKLVQGTYHPAYNSRTFRVEASADGKTFSPLFEGELENRLGAIIRRSFPPREASTVRVVITAVYPNVDYSSPSLAEIEIGLGTRRWTETPSTVSPQSSF